GREGAGGQADAGRPRRYAAAGAQLDLLGLIEQRQRACRVSLDAPDASQSNIAVYQRPIGAGRLPEGDALHQARLGFVQMIPFVMETAQASISRPRCGQGLPSPLS